MTLMLMILMLKMVSEYSTHNIEETAVATTVTDDLLWNYFTKPYYHDDDGSYEFR